MTLDKANFNSIDVYNPILGSGLEVPRMFWKPGTSASYNHHVGKTSITGLWQGTLMAGMNPDSPFSYLGSPGNINLHWPSLTTYYGDHIVIGRSTVLGGSFRTAVASATMGAVGGAKVISGSSAKMAAPRVVLAGATVKITGALVSLPGAANFRAKAAIWDSKKGFDIPHPTKQNHRLRYICLEGPTADVHIRGKSKSNTIELPDYWTGLVDVESITVSLTPIGSYQQLFVETIDLKNGIVIGNNSGDQFNYQYTVFAERIDGEKNIPEYEGLTPDDYPGDNREYNINT